MIVETVTGGLQGPTGPGTADRGGFLAGTITNALVLGAYLVTRACTLTSCRVKVGTAPPASNQTIELRKNGVAQATLTILASQTDSGATSVSVVCAAGDIVSLVSTAAVSAADAYWSVTASTT